MSDRYYDINGNLYPSVTTALSVIRKPFLERWRGEHGNEEADQIRDEAGDIGREIHDCCQAVDEKKPYYTASPVVAQIAENYRQWAEAYVKTWVKIEEVVHCKHYGYAGRLDRVAVLKGDRKPTVIDLKSGYVSKEHGLQLAAYQHCLEDAGLTPHRRLVLHLDKKNPDKPPCGKEITTDYQADLRLFVYALELYKYFEGGNKKNVSIVNA